MEEESEAWDETTEWWIAAAREDYAYTAKLAEQAERYEGAELFLWFHSLPHQPLLLCVSVLPLVFLVLLVLEEGLCRVFDAFGTSVLCSSCGAGALRCVSFFLLNLLFPSRG